MSSPRPPFGVLRSILAEADLIMAVDGYPSLADLTPDSPRRTGPHRS